MLLICVVCALVVQSIFVQSFGSPEPTPTVKSSLEATLVTLEEDLLFSSHTAPGVWRAKYDAGQPVCSWEGITCCQAVNTTQASVSNIGLQFYAQLDFRLLPCSAAEVGAVVAISLRGALVGGSIHANTGSSLIATLTSLRLLDLSHNPGLHGALPGTLFVGAHPSFLIDVRNTSLRTCGIAGAVDGAATLPSACLLPDATSFQAQGATYQTEVMAGGASLLCLADHVQPRTSFASPPAALSSSNPPAQPVASVLADPGYWWWQSCVCNTASRQQPGLQASLDAVASGTDAPVLSAVPLCTSPAAGALNARRLGASGDGGSGRLSAAGIAAVVLGVVLGVALVGLALMCCVFVRVRSALNMDSSKHGLEAGVGSITAAMSPLSLRAARASMTNLGGEEGAVAVPPNISPRVMTDIKREFAPGTKPDVFGGTLVTLAATDVQGSTELWEWNPDVMNHALAMHDALMRSTLHACGGYEVTTEGDAFLTSWHSPVDAARWCCMVQLGLMQLSWPPELLDHPLGRPRPLPTTADPVAMGTPVLFRGLAVRMGLATGEPSSICEHPVTRRVQYSGTVLRLAMALTDSGSGGQVLMDPISYKGAAAALERLAPDSVHMKKLTTAVDKMYAQKPLAPQGQDAVPTAMPSAVAGAGPPMGPSELTPGTLFASVSLPQHVGSNLSTTGSVPCGPAAYTRQFQVEHAAVATVLPDNHNGDPDKSLSMSLARTSTNLTSQSVNVQSGSMLPASVGTTTQTLGVGQALYLGGIGSAQPRAPISPPATPRSSLFWSRNHHTHHLEALYLKAAGVTARPTATAMATATRPDTSTTTYSRMSTDGLHTSHQSHHRPGATHNRDWNQARDGEGDREAEGVEGNQGLRGGTHHRISNISPSASGSHARMSSCRAPSPSRVETLYPQSREDQGSCGRTGTNYLTTGASRLPQFPTATVLSAVQSVGPGPVQLGPTVHPSSNESSAPGYTVPRSSVMDSHSSQGHLPSSAQHAGLQPRRLPRRVGENVNGDRQHASPQPHDSQEHGMQGIRRSVTDVSIAAGGSVHSPHHPRARAVMRTSLSSSWLDAGLALDRSSPLVVLGPAASFPSSIATVSRELADSAAVENMGPSSVGLDDSAGDLAHQSQAQGRRPRPGVAADVGAALHHHQHRAHSAAVLRASAGLQAAIRSNQHLSGIVPMTQAEAFESRIQAATGPAAGTGSPSLIHVAPRPGMTEAAKPEGPSMMELSPLDDRSTASNNTAPTATTASSAATANTLVHAGHLATFDSWGERGSHPAHVPHTRTRLSGLIRACTMPAAGMAPASGDASLSSTSSAAAHGHSSGWHRSSLTFVPHGALPQSGTHPSSPLTPHLGQGLEDTQDIATAPLWPMPDKRGNAGTGAQAAEEENGVMVVAELNSAGTLITAAPGSPGGSARGPNSHMVGLRTQDSLDTDKWFSGGERHIGPGPVAEGGEEPQVWAHRLQQVSAEEAGPSTGTSAKSAGGGDQSTSAFPKGIARFSALLSGALTTGGKEVERPPERPQIANMVEQPALRSQPSMQGRQFSKLATSLPQDPALSSGSQSQGSPAPGSGKVVKLIELVQSQLKLAPAKATLNAGLQSTSASSCLRDMSGRILDSGLAVIGSGRVPSATSHAPVTSGSFAAAMRQLNQAPAALPPSALASTAAAALALVADEERVSWPARRTPSAHATCMRSQSLRDLSHAMDWEHMEEGGYAEGDGRASSPRPASVPVLPVQAFTAAHLAAVTAGLTSSRVSAGRGIRKWISDAVRAEAVAPAPGYPQAGTGVEVSAADDQEDADEAVARLAAEVAAEWRGGRRPAVPERSAERVTTLLPATVEAADTPAGTAGCVVDPATGMSPNSRPDSAELLSHVLKASGATPPDPAGNHATAAAGAGAGPADGDKNPVPTIAGGNAAKTCPKAALVKALDLSRRHHGLNVHFAEAKVFWDGKHHPPGSRGSLRRLKTRIETDLTGEGGANGRRAYGRSLSWSASSSASQHSEHSPLMSRQSSSRFRGIEEQVQAPEAACAPTTHLDTSHQGDEADATLGGGTRCESAAQPDIGRPPLKPKRSMPTRVASSRLAPRDAAAALVDDAGAASSVATVLHRAPGLHLPRKSRSLYEVTTSREYKRKLAEQHEHQGHHENGDHKGHHEPTNPVDAEVVPCEPAAAFGHHQAPPLYPRAVTKAQSHHVPFPMQHGLFASSSAQRRRSTGEPAAGIATGVGETNASLLLHYPHVLSVHPLHSIQEPLSRALSLYTVSKRSMDYPVYLTSAAPSSSLAALASHATGQSLPQPTGSAGAWHGAEQRGVVAPSSTTTRTSGTFSGLTTLTVQEIEGVARYERVASISAAKALRLQEEWSNVADNPLCSYDEMPGGSHEGPSVHLTASPVQPTMPWNRLGPGPLSPSSPHLAMPPPVPPAITNEIAAISKPLVAASKLPTTPALAHVPVPAAGPAASALTLSGRTLRNHASHSSTVTTGGNSSTSGSHQTCQAGARRDPGTQVFDSLPSSGLASAVAMGAADSEAPNRSSAASSEIARSARREQQRRFSHPDAGQRMWPRGRESSRLGNRSSGVLAGGTLAEISEGGVACEDDWMHASSCATTAGLESVRPTSADVSTGDGQGAGSNTKAPPASVIGMGVHGVCVVDMGIHRLRGAHLYDVNDVYDGVQIIQLLPASLLARAALFPRLATDGALTPGFLDAPGASHALTPLPTRGPRLFPSVTLFFISPAHYTRIAAEVGPSVGERALGVFCTAVRGVMHAYGLYECQEFEGCVMGAAHTPRAAVEAALHLQQVLLGCDWPLEVLDCASAAHVADPTTGATVFRGLRAKVGIYEGVPLSVVPHATTGRADYFGVLVNRAARLMAGSQPGQVLVDAAAAGKVVAEWRALAVAQEALTTAPSAVTSPRMRVAGSSHPPSQTQAGSVGGTTGLITTLSSSAIMAMDVLSMEDQTLRSLGNATGTSPPATHTSHEPLYSVPLHTLNPAGIGAAFRSPTPSQTLPQPPHVRRRPQEAAAASLLLSTLDSMLSQSAVLTPGGQTPSTCETPQLSAALPPVRNILSSQHGSYPRPIYRTSSNIFPAPSSTLNSNPTRSPSSVTEQGVSHRPSTSTNTSGRGRVGLSEAVAAAASMAANPSLPPTLHHTPGSVPAVCMALPGVGGGLSLVSSEEVQVVDLGDFELKGVATPQAVIGFMLTSLAGRSAMVPAQLPQGKAKCMRSGKGVVDRVRVTLAPMAAPMALTAAVQSLAAVMVAAAVVGPHGSGGHEQP